MKNRTNKPTIVVSKRISNDMAYDFYFPKNLFSYTFLAVPSECLSNLTTFFSFFKNGENKNPNFNVWFCDLKQLDSKLIWLDMSNMWVNDIGFCKNKKPLFGNTEKWKIYFGYKSTFKDNIKWNYKNLEINFCNMKLF